MACPGSYMKASAAAELRICARHDGRPHLGVYCQLYARSQGAWLQLMCACGLVCILRSGEEETETVSSSIPCAVTIESAMNALATMSLQALCLPLPRSMKTPGRSSVWQRERYGVELQAYVYDALSELRDLDPGEGLEGDVTVSP